MTDLNRRRARQYAVCTYALDYDHVTDGAEGVLDQALTNGLAAIVSHEWRVGLELSVVCPMVTALKSAISMNIA
jgi:hypothetical protein